MEIPVGKTALALLGIYLGVGTILAVKTKLEFEREGEDKVPLRPLLFLTVAWPLLVAGKP